MALRRAVPAALAVFVLPLIGLSACAVEPTDDEVEATLADDGVDPTLCRTCNLPNLPSPPVVYLPRYCSDVCSERSSCEATCDSRTGGTTTCGAYGVCRACSASVCSSPLACSTQCKGPSGAVQSCTTWSGAQRGDADLDGLPDWLETALAQKFYPNLNMHCGSYRGWNHGSKGQYYGSDVRCGNTPDANLPVTVRKVGPLSNGWCAGGECIEVVYGLPFASDLGDNSTIGEHVGDSEMYAALLAYKRPSVGFEGAEFATASSYAEALTSASHWAIIKEFSGAHMCESSRWDSSRFHRPRYYSNGLKEHALTPNYLWTAEGKNATYFSQAECNAGGGGFDDCSDNRCLLNRSVGVAKLRNAGELFCHPAPAFDALIPSAGPEVAACGTPNAYNVWSGLKYGTATPFKQKLNENVIDWGNDTYRCD